MKMESGIKGEPSILDDFNYGSNVASSSVTIRLGLFSNNQYIPGIYNFMGRLKTYLLQHNRLCM